MSGMALVYRFLAFFWSAIMVTFIYLRHIAMRCFSILPYAPLFIFKSFTDYNPGDGVIAITCPPSYVTEITVLP